MLPPRLVKLWSAMCSGLWFLPALSVGLGLVLGLALPAVDRRWGEALEVVRSHWLFTYVPSTPGGSREVLIAMAAALATIVAVSVSMTMVTVQLAASQYTPRLLRHFMANRVTQRALGVFVGTVVYLLLVLGAVSSHAVEEGQLPPPALSLVVALVLTLMCLLLLPRFLHHAARSVEASTIIASVGQETIQALHEMRLDLDAELGEALPGPDEAPTVVRGRATGYLQRVDEERLVAALPPGVHTVRLEARTGDFLFPGLPLVSLWPRVPLDARCLKRIHAALVVGRQRTAEQDVLFGVRQLVDMALKALSPAINDVTTAFMVVNELGAVGRAVARQGHVGQGWWSRRRRGVTVLVHGFGLAPFLQEAFREIPLAAASQPRVIARILEVLAQLAGVEEEDALRALLVQCGRAVHEATHHTSLREADAQLIEERWLELQQVAARSGATTAAPIH